MPLGQLLCGVLSNIHVTMAKSGMKGRKPDKTSMGVEALLWQGRRNLAATNARSGLRRAVEGNRWVAHIGWPPVRSVKLTGWLCLLR